MSETRYSYAYNRVLIDADRILTPQFDPAVIYVTGAQLEMLRNVTQYLNRLETYASEYQPGYYLAPSIADYDDILEIVADLEETLMGNPNTIWGYDDRWVEHVEFTAIADGGVDVDADPVPNGYVYTLQSITMRNKDKTDATIPKIVAGSDIVPIGINANHGLGIYRIIPGLNYTLKYGDYVRVRFYGTLDTNRLEVFLWGYKMVVPEE